MVFHNNPTTALRGSTTQTVMKFFDFPTEIRLKVYSELLVHQEPIEFVAEYGPLDPCLIRCEGDGLCPAILRVNKKAHSEASPLLYSNNRFEFIYIIKLKVLRSAVSPRVSPAKMD
jgi:hypothetical protein